MPFKQLKNFKGINEFLDEPSEEFAAGLSNLDSDEILGRLTLRKGFSKKYTSGFPLTNIISAFEFTIEETGDVVLLLNDGGTFKWMKNGAALTTLTNPTGSAVASDFTHNYFGWRNAIRVTTGNGSTNHVLWFGYTKRDTADNDGLFGDVLDDNGTYRFLRQQLISEGVFSRIFRVVKIGTKFYVSFRDSKYIEVRDSNYQLIERRLPFNNADITVNLSVGLATDGTYLYVSLSGKSTDNILQVDPNSFAVLKTYSWITGTGNPIDIAVNSTHVYAVKGDLLLKLLISDFSTVSTDFTGMNSLNAIAADDTAIYIGDVDGASDPLVRRRVVGDITTDTSVSAVFAASGTVADLYLDATNSLLFTTATIGNHYLGGVQSEPAGYTDNIVVLADTDMTSISATHTTVDGASVFFDSGSDEPYCVSEKFGTLNSITAQGVIAPVLITLQAKDYITATGIDDSGTYFYKVSLVDVEGQEYPLSDHIMFHGNGAAESVDIRITIPEDDVTAGQFYRVKYIRLYRASNGISEDELKPSTEYKQLVEIDINSTGWSYDATNEVYYYDYEDRTDEATIGNVTFRENSGYSDNVKPRYVNGKYFTWLNDRLHMANVYTDGDTYISRVVQSPEESPDALVFFDVYKYQEDEGNAIKGLSNAYGRTIVCKEKRIGVFYNLKKEQEYFPGISSDKGYYKNNNDFYYSNKTGVFVLRGNTHQRINDPVITTYGAISDYTSGLVFYFDDKDRLFVCFEDEEGFKFNMKYGSVDIYSAAFSFKGIFKNSDNEYIGFKDSYFYKLFDTAIDDSFDIDILYESPRIPFVDGFDNEFFQIMRRMAISISGDGITPTLKIYQHYDSGTGKVLVKTVTFSEMNYTTLVNATDFIQNVWGEAFSISIQGTVSAFQLSHLLLKYNIIGEDVG